MPFTLAIIEFYFPAKQTPFPDEDWSDMCWVDPTGENINRIHHTQNSSGKWHVKRNLGENELEHKATIEKEDSSFTHQQIEMVTRALGIQPWRLSILCSGKRRWWRAWTAIAAASSLSSQGGQAEGPIPHQVALWFDIEQRSWRVFSPTIWDQATPLTWPAFIECLFDTKKGVIERIKPGHSIRMTLISTGMIECSLPVPVPPEHTRAERLYLGV